MEGTLQGAIDIIHVPSLYYLMTLPAVAEVVGRNWVQWSAAQLSNEIVLLHTTDSTP